MRNGRECRCRLEVNLIETSSDRNIIRQCRDSAYSLHRKPSPVYFNFMTIPVVRTSEKSMRRWGEFSIQSYVQMSIIPRGCFTYTKREDLRTSSGRKAQLSSMREAIVEQAVTTYFNRKFPKFSTSQQCGVQFGTRNTASRMLFCINPLEMKQDTLSRLRSARALPLPIPRAQARAQLKRLYECY